MNSLARALLVGAALCVSGSVVHADQISDLNNQLDLIKKKIEVATKQKELIQLETDLAKAEEGIATSLMNAANNKFTAAQKELARPAPQIHMSSGTLYVIKDPQRSCNALPFLRWQCNGVDTCASFVVDQNICGLPGTMSEPMELSLAYLCGDQTVKDVFPFGQPAKLTCKGYQVP